MQWELSKPPYEQMHNFSKEQKRENEITVNMSKALDSSVLDIAIKVKNRAKYCAGPSIIHWQSPMTREGENLLLFRFLMTLTA